MSQAHTKDTENKTHINSANIAPIMGEDEYIMSSSSGDIGEMVSRNSPPLKPVNVLQLQRELGNQATMNIINRQTATTSSPNISAFTGLKMVTPGTIQRDPNDDEPPAKADEIDEDQDKDPKDAVELDGADNEVQQETNEIDQTINEAKQIDSIAQENAKWHTDDYVDDDDDWSVSYNADDYDPVAPNNSDTPQATTQNNAVNIDGDSDDENVYDSNKPKNLGMISHQKQHKQKQGLNIKGKNIAAESMWPAIGQAAIDVPRNANTAVDIEEASTAIKNASSLKDALTSVTDTSTDIGSGKIIDGLEKVLEVFNVPPINILLSIGSLIFRIVSAKTKYTHMKAFKTLMEGNKGDTKLRKGALADKQTIGSYGYAKTKRGFWLRVVKAAINVGEIIARMITVLSGGASALVTEATAVAMGLSNGIIKVGQSLKGIYKMIMGKRGKRRNESANWIVDGALDGDVELLQFMLDADIISDGYREMRQFILVKNQKPDTAKDKLEKLRKLTLKPTDPESLQKYLKIAEEVDALAGIKGRVATATKST